MTAYNLGTIYAEHGEFALQEKYMLRSQRIFLAKWNAAASPSFAASCAGGKRRLVTHWHGEPSVKLRVVEQPIPAGE